MAVELQDGSVLVFGIDTPTTSYGITQNFTITEGVETASARGAFGNTVSVVQFDKKKTLSLNFMPLGSQTSPPEIGTQFTFEGISTWILESIAQTGTVDGFETYDITATSYSNLP